LSDLWQSQLWKSFFRLFMNVVLWKLRLWVFFWIMCFVSSFQSSWAWTMDTKMINYPYPLIFPEGFLNPVSLFSVAIYFWVDFQVFE
jgi:hypothetical protein